MLHELRRGETREFVRQNRQLRSQMRLLWLDIERLMERQRQILEKIADRSKGSPASLEVTSAWEFQPDYPETDGPSDGRQVPFLRKELDAQSHGWRRNAIALLKMGMEFAVKNLSPREVRVCAGLAGHYGVEYHVEEIAIDAESVCPKRLRFSRRWS